MVLSKAMMKLVKFHISPRISNNFRWKTKNNKTTKLIKSQVCFSKMRIKVRSMI